MISSSTLSGVKQDNKDSLELHWIWEIAFIFYMMPPARAKMPLNFLALHKHWQMNGTLHLIKSVVLGMQRGLAWATNCHHRVPWRGYVECSQCGFYCNVGVMYSIAFMTDARQSSAHGGKWGWWTLGIEQHDHAFLFTNSYTKVLGLERGSDETWQRATTHDERHRFQQIIADHAPEGQPFHAS